MDGEDGKQQAHLVLADKLFLLMQPDVDDIDKVRLRHQVLAAVVADDMAILYENLVATSVLELDQKVLDSMRAKNVDELKKLDDKISDAEENLGESEVREAHLAKSLFYIRIGDKMEDMFKNMTFAPHTAAAVGSIALSVALTYPIDTLKTLIQVGSNSSKQLTPAQVLHRVRTLSGNSGLYNGFGWLALGRMPGLAARFGTYEILTAFYKDGREDNYVYASEALMAGIATGVVESIINTPFELLKIRSQVTSASLVPSNTSSVAMNAVSPSIAKLFRGHYMDMKALNKSAGLLSTLNTKHPNMISALKDYPWMMTGSGRPPAVYNVRNPRDIITLEGSSALWRGLRSGIFRDSIFCGVFFSSWQVLHQAMLDWKAVSMDPPPRYDEEIGPLSPLSVSFAAGISGSVAAASSHCFDTAKSRSQCIVVPKFISMERRLLKWSRPGNRFESFTGIHPRDRNILFRGIWLRMARSGIASFLLVGSYYFAVDQLVSP